MTPENNSDFVRNKLKENSTSEMLLQQNTNGMWRETGEVEKVDEQRQRDAEIREIETNRRQADRRNGE